MTASLPRTGSYLRLLRFSLVGGALFDIALAALLVAGPRVPEQLLGVPRPAQAFYLWLLAVLLGILALFYLLAAYDPMSYQGNVLIAILGRDTRDILVANP